MRSGSTTANELRFSAKIRFDGEDPGSNATLIVSNSTISGNHANFGAGAYNDGINGMATMSVNNSTFSANPAGSSGGGIFTIGNSGTATVHIGNTILLTGAMGSDIDSINSTVTSHGYNLSNQGGAGVLISTGDQINTDPMLGPLKDNGGPNLTHAPLIHSPAIDQGKRDAIPTLTTNSDQRGFARPVGDPTVVNFVDGSDIGAVEVGQFVHPIDAASWKTHGAAGPFSIGLSLFNTPSVECRSGGASGVYQIIVNFTTSVSVNSAEVVSGTGGVSGISVTGANRAPRAGVKNVRGPNGFSGGQVTIDLSGVTNAQNITVALFGTSDGTNTADIGIRMGVLVGDTTGNGSVNATDVSQGTVTEDSFVDDVTANGSINSSDISLTKSKSGTGLP